MTANIINLHFDDYCSTCGAHLPPSTKAMWDRDAHEATCLQCVLDKRDSQTIDEALLEAIGVPKKPDSGAAGASARREYERRHAKREAELDRDSGDCRASLSFSSTIRSRRGPGPKAPKASDTWPKDSRGASAIARFSCTTDAFHEAGPTSITWPSRPRAYG